MIWSAAVGETECHNYYGVTYGKDNIAALEKEKQASLEREKAALERAETAEKSAQAAEKQLEELNGKILSAEELKAIEGKKSIGGALKNVSWEEWQSVKATADSTKAKSVEIARQKKKTNSSKAKTRNFAMIIRLYTMS